MRHRKTGVKLNRTTSHRQAMFRNMVTSLFKYERIRTTDVKAKELRKWADHIITLAKRGDLHARRQALSIVREKDIVHKLFSEAADRFGNINGGYTRIVKIGRRPGDAAPISLIELVSSDDRAPKGKKKAKTSPKKQAKAETPVAATKTESPVTEPETPSEATATPVEAAQGDLAPETAEGDTVKETEKADAKDAQAATADAEEAPAAEAADETAADEKDDAENKK